MENIITQDEVRRIANLTHLNKQSEINTQVISDVAEAITALMRVCGFNKNHYPILNACFAAASSKGNEFRASHAEIGARMVNEIQPYKRNMDAAESAQRGRNLTQRFSRAWNQLKADQLATGLWFVKMRSGGHDKFGRRQKSLFQVDVDTVVQTIKYAKLDNEYTGNYRHRAFERAAEKAIEAKARIFVDECAPLATVKSEREQVRAIAIKRRTGMKTAKTGLYRAIKSAVLEEQQDFVVVVENILAELRTWMDTTVKARLAMDSEKMNFEASPALRTNVSVESIKAKETVAFTTAYDELINNLATRDERKAA